MKKSLFLTICLIVCIACSCWAASQTLPYNDPNKLLYPPLHFKPPQAERIIFSNGMILYILEDHELPLVNISAAIRTGSYFDPVGKEGLAELVCMVMRTGGTEVMSGSVVDETLEALATDINISAQMDSVSVSFSSLKANLDKGIEILSQIMMHPVFADDKLALAKNLKIEELKRTADDPQQLAFREFNRVFYRGDPRGRLASVRSVAKIERADLIQFYRRFFGPDQIMVALTGDITKNEAVRLLEKSFGAWPKLEHKEEIPPPANKLQGGIYYLPKDIPQSIVITGNFAPAKGSPDYYIFTVLDFILGSGGFPSRIFQEIRTNQGLAYSAGSFYRPRTAYGVFGTYAMTKSESTTKVLSLLRSIVGKVNKEPVNMKELSWAKNSLSDSFIFSFKSTAHIAQQQLLLEFDKLPQDYLIKYQERIKKVGFEDLKKTAVNYLSVGENVIFVMGKENIFDQLIAAFGKVEKINSDND